MNPINRPSLDKQSAKTNSKDKVAAVKGKNLTTPKKTKINRTLEIEIQSNEKLEVDNDSLIRVIDPGLWTGKNRTRKRCSTPRSVCTRQTNVDVNDSLQSDEIQKEIEKTNRLRSISESIDLVVQQSNRIAKKINKLSLKKPDNEKSPKQPSIDNKDVLDSPTNSKELNSDQSMNDKIAKVVHSRINTKADNLSTSSKRRRISNRQTRDSNIVTRNSSIEHMQDNAYCSTPDEGNKIPLNDNKLDKRRKIPLRDCSPVEENKITLNDSTPDKGSKILLDNRKLAESNKVALNENTPDKGIYVNDVEKTTYRTDVVRTNTNLPATSLSTNCNTSKSDLEKSCSLKNETDEFSYNLGETKNITNKKTTPEQKNIAFASSSIRSSGDLERVSSIAFSNLNDIKNRMPIIKSAGLPVIKVTQGDSDGESRQVGFATFNIRPDDTKSLNSFGASFSTCSLQTSSGEDFAEFETDFDLCWSEKYNFDEDQIFKMQSDDTVFIGAALSTETKPNERVASYSSVALPINPNSTLSLKHDIPQKRFVLSNDISKKSCDNEATINLELHKDSISNNLLDSGILNCDARSSDCDSRILNQTDSNSVQKDKNYLFQFKVPVLPRAKRPPTRSKGSTSISGSSGSSGSVCSGSNLSKPSNIKSRLSLPPCLGSNDVRSEASEDDAISIYAESLISNEHSETRFRSHTELRLDALRSSANLTNKTQNVASVQTTNSQIKSTNPNIEKDNIRSTNLVNTSKQSNNMLNLAKIEKISQEVSPPTSSQPLADFPNQEVARWISTGNYSNVRRKVDTNAIPKIFKSLCYFHFTYGCNNMSCKRPHYVPGFIHYSLKKGLEFSVLKSAYEYAKDRHLLYCETLWSFIEAFQEYPKNIELSSLVGDVFQIITTDKSPYINKLIVYSEAQGQLFSDVILDIVCREGIKNLALVEILLHIVCDRKRDLINNWNLVNKLFKYINQDQADYILVQSLIEYCNTSKNTALGKLLVNDIISPYKVELNAMNISTLHNFYTFLRSSELLNEAEMLEKKLNSFNIHPFHINSPSSVSTLPLLDNSNNQEDRISNANSTNETSLFNIFKRLHTEQETITGEDRVAMLASTNSLTTDQNYITRSISRPPDVLSPSHIGKNFDRNDKESSNLQPLNKSQGESLLAFSPRSTSNTDTPGVANKHFFPKISLPYSYPTHVINSQNGFFNSLLKTTMPFSEGEINYEDIHFAPLLQNGNSPLLDINNLENASGTTEVLDSSQKELAGENLQVLLDVIRKTENLQAFIEMVNKYKNGPYTASFVTHTIFMFKDFKPEQTCQFMTNVFKDLNAASANDEDIKNIMRMLCVNILSILETQEGFDAAADILELFYYDLHNLISTVWLRLHKYVYTHIGKYIYFCRIFTMGKRYELAYKIFTSPDLKLIQSHNLWNVQYVKEFDVPFRNDILQEFISSTLKNDLRIAMNMIVCILTSTTGNNYEIGIWKYFNKLIFKMVDCGIEYVEELKQMLPKILTDWYLALNGSILRGLVVALVAHIRFDDIECLYSRCVSKGLYPRIIGHETSIPLMTNMTYEEIYLVFKIYFSKIVNGRSINDLTLIIMPTEYESQSPKVLTNAHSPIEQLKSRVCTVLAKCFKYTINVYPSDDESYIKIDREELKAFINASTADEL